MQLNEKKDNEQWGNSSNKEKMGDTVENEAQKTIKVILMYMLILMLNYQLRPVEIN